MVVLLLIMQMLTAAHCHFALSSNLVSSGYESACQLAAASLAGQSADDVGCALCWATLAMVGSLALIGIVMSGVAARRAALVPAQLPLERAPAGRLLARGPPR